jgi:hypothetical protein
MRFFLYCKTLWYVEVYVFMFLYYKVWQLNGVLVHQLAAQMIHHMVGLMTTVFSSFASVVIQFVLYLW